MSPPAINRKYQLITILVSVIAVTSSANHFVARLLNVRTNLIDRGTINPGAPGKPALVMGSSLIFFGVSFREVAHTLGRPLVTRSVGGASPCELEPLSLEVPEAARTIIGVSIFDLNENNLSDSRPLLVALHQTVSDIWASQTDWPYAKRVLWSYPLPWLQELFPVAGRSTTVMVNLRDKATKLVVRHPAREQQAQLSFKSDEDAVRPERLSDWDAGRVSRNLAQLRSSGLGCGHFNGPKSLAFGRMLTRARNRERTVVLVLPVSPPYRQAFVDAALAAKFEAALRQATTYDPAMHIIRLDEEPSLQPAEVFWDLVHLNDEGRRRATRLVLEQLSSVTVK